MFKLSEIMCHGNNIITNAAGRKIYFLLTLLCVVVLALVHLVNCRVGEQQIASDHVFGKTVEHHTNTGRHCFIAISISYESGFIDCSPIFDLQILYIIHIIYVIFYYEKVTLAYTTMAVIYLHLCQMF